MISLHCPGARVHGTWLCGVSPRCKRESTSRPLGVGTFLQGAAAGELLRTLHTPRSRGDSAFCIRLMCAASKSSDLRGFVAETDLSADHVAHTHELEPVMQRSPFGSTPANGAFPEVSLITDHMIPNSPRVQDDAFSLRVFAGLVMSRVDAFPVRRR